MNANVFSYALQQIEVPTGEQLWLYGEPGVAISTVYQPWQDAARQLNAKGCTVVSDLHAITQDYDAVFVSGTRQQEETQGLMALALNHSHGLVMAVGANDAGGNRLRKMMQAYGVEVHHASKSHHQIVWTLQAPKADQARIVQQMKHLALRQMEAEGQSWWTVQGLFGWDKIDAGSQMLLAHLPKDLSGKVADFGCGYGYLSAHLAHNPGIIQVDAYDADARAVTATAKNAPHKVNVLWQDIRTLQKPKYYDAVVMNPPFHQSGTQSLELGRAFIAKALESLRPGGRLFMVANRHLAYENAAPQLSIVHQAEGYKIMTARA